MSIFTSTTTHELVSETPLPTCVDRDVAIAFLQHDQTSFLKLQTLVTDIQPIPPPPSSQWVVQEALSARSLPSSANTNPATTDVSIPIQYRAVTISVPVIPPFWSQTITSHLATINTPEGIIVAFQAPMGIHGRNQYRVVDALDGSGLVLREEAVVTGPRWLMGFTVGKEREQHARHRVCVVEELGRRARAEGVE